MLFVLGLKRQTQTLIASIKVKGGQGVKVSRGASCVVTLLLRTTNHAAATSNGRHRIEFCCGIDILAVIIYDLLLGYERVKTAALQVMSILRQAFSIHQCRINWSVTVNASLELLVMKLCETQDCFSKINFATRTVWLCTIVHPDIFARLPKPYKRNEFVPHYKTNRYRKTPVRQLPNNLSTNLLLVILFDTTELLVFCTVNQWTIASSCSVTFTRS